MKKEREYLYEIEVAVPERGCVIKPHIAYRPDRCRPWTVDIGSTEMSPTYTEIGFAQAYLRRHYSWKNNPNCLAMKFMKKSLFFDKLKVNSCDRS